MGGAKNCPETPRQKMIGMMYLVLTAMLALNVSAAILNGYTQVDDSLHATIETTVASNKEIYRSFEAAMAQNPEKTKEWYDKAMQVKAKSDELFDYIQGFKDKMVTMCDGSKAVPNATVRQLGKQDDTNIPHQYALKEGNALILKDKIAEYRNFLKEITTADQEHKPQALHDQIDAMFATEGSVNAEKKPITWEQSIFEEMPICASITVLTKLQNDVRNYEGKIVQFLQSGTDASDLRVNKLNAYVIPKSEYVIRGGKYTAQIILAAIDSTQQPEYYIDGQRINDQGIYEVVASGSGMKKFTGKIAYMSNLGEMQELPFESSYIVGEPSVTISNTDLNIMYRGYDNKFSISVPGVPNDKVKVSVNGAALSRQGGFWIIKPGDAAKSVTISVSAELEGRMQSMGSRDYRVKGLPKPGAYFKSGETEYQEGNISRGALLNNSAVVIASYGPDGLLDLPFKITSFKVNINGVLTEAKGDKFTAQQRQQLEKLKKGAVVVIADVRAKGPDGKDTRLSPIPLTLN